MQSSAGSRRVVVAVEPRLLADTLGRALTEPDIEVTVWVDPPAEPLEPFDLAVVGGTPAEVPEARVVVRLGADQQDGSVTTVMGTESASVSDLPALVETVRRCLRG